MAEDWFIARRWRVGGQVGRTLYVDHGDGDKDPLLLFGMVDTPEIAEHIVALHNAQFDGPLDEK